MVYEEKLKKLNESQKVLERIKSWSSNKDVSEWTDDEVVKFLIENRTFIENLDLSLISDGIAKETIKDIGKLQKALQNGRYKFSALKKLICEIFQGIFSENLIIERYKKF
ncbi:MAG: hypothetical protein ACI4L6_02505 [Candidatus Onthoplasma sp.]